MLTFELVWPLVAFATAGAAATGLPPPFVTPPRRYLKESSFRGVNEATGRVSNFDVSGQGTSLPGVHDFLRLVPPTPLAHGAVFSAKPLQSDEWIVEIAFRQHGPATVGVIDGEDGSSTRVHKGGRGLAFWYTKNPSAGPVTLPSDPKRHPSPPPPLVPLTPTDPSDPNVSLFGHATQFDGLGVIFDATPAMPVYRRSDSRNWDNVVGMGSSGVVSGLLDDGTGSWLDPEEKTRAADEEANYLSSSFAECEAAWRGARGLLWARISNINNTIRVDLDLSPHTTLSDAGRDYIHNCFSLPGVTLAKGHYLGISGIASGSTEPDIIDVYAMDVFEVLKDGKTADGKVADAIAPPKVDAAPLEGTTEDPVSTLAHEIFLSQARMVEAIDSLSRRVELLSRTLSIKSDILEGSSSLTPDGVIPQFVLNRLASIEGSIVKVAEAQKATQHQNNERGETETLAHLLQLQERLMVELKAFGRKMDTTNSQGMASLATLSSRSAESLQLLQRAIEENAAAMARTSPWLWILLVGGVGAGGWAWWRNRREGGGYGKKMI